jgi:hypothetical protein
MKRIAESRVGDRHYDFRHRLGRVWFPLQQQQCGEQDVNHVNHDNHRQTAIESGAAHHRSGS